MVQLCMGLGYHQMIFVCSLKWRDSGKHGCYKKRTLGKVRLEQILYGVSFKWNFNVEIFSFCFFLPPPPFPLLLLPFLIFSVITTYTQIVACRIIMADFQWIAPLIQMNSLGHQVFTFLFILFQILRFTRLQIYETGAL